MFDDRVSGSTPRFKSQFASRDVGEVRAYVSQLFCNHELQIIGSRQHLDTRIGITDLGEVRFVSLHHGAHVRVTAECLDDYILQIPLGGSGRAVINSREMQIGRNMAYIISPVSRFSLEFSSECGHLILRINRNTFDRFYRDVARCDLQGPVIFNPFIELDRPGAAQAVRIIRLMLAEANRPDSGLDAPTVAAQVESLILGLLINSLPYEHLRTGGVPVVPVSRATPVYVRRAQTYMQLNVRNAVTIEDVASAARTSVSSIYAGFRNHLKLSPMACLKSMRLECAHRDLLGAERDGTTVSAVASKYGFNHFGNFAADYKRQIGESPSETLRRSRSRSIQ